MSHPGVPFLLVCWCWCFAVAGAKYQQLVTENQQKTSKIPANPVFSIFFRKNIFKILFFIKYLLLSHLGTKQNFYFDVLLVPVGTEKKPFLIENGKNSKFSIPLSSNSTLFNPEHTISNDFFQTKPVFFNKPTRLNISLDNSPLIKIPCSLS